MKNTTEKQRLGLKFIAEEREKAVWFRIEGLTSEDFLEMIREQGEGRMDHIKDVIERHSMDAQLLISEALARKIGMIDDRVVPEYNLEEVPRALALKAIAGRARKDLGVAHHRKAARFSRWISSAQSEDRFIALSQYDGHKRDGECLMSNHFLMVEIDDPNLRNAVDDFGSSVLKGFAKGHIEAGTNAVKVIMRDIVSPPFIVSYSGSKSFHMLWQWNRPMLNSERDECRRAFLHRVGQAREAKEKGGCDVIAERLLAIDGQIPFSATALFRVSCDLVEAGRHKQVTYKTGCVGILDADRALEVAREINRARENLALLDRISRIEHYRQHGGELEKGPLPDGLIEAALDGVKRRSSGGYVCKCPRHKDENASAFVSDNGFIYCSVCCAGESWVARVKRDGTVAMNERQF